MSLKQLHETSFKGNPADEIKALLIHEQTMFLIQMSPAVCFI